MPGGPAVTVPWPAPRLGTPAAGGPGPCPAVTVTVTESGSESRVSAAVGPVKPATLELEFYCPGPRARGPRPGNWPPAGGHSVARRIPSRSAAARAAAAAASRVAGSPSHRAVRVRRLQHDIFARALRPGAAGTP